MTPSEKASLSKVRFNHSEECLKSAETLLKDSDYKGAANRSYYAIFHALRAILVYDDFDSRKHSGIISTFNKLYIKTNIFDKDVSRITSNSFDIRTDSDYNDFFMISKDGVINQINDTKKVIELIRVYLSNKWSVNP
ncbi:MAG: HEPN domain-containing protein [Candidatus Riflebacteria bacterium]|nr:HEPN domain-containing protein [Candidatus Riflebacteria bacterium]